MHCPESFSLWTQADRWHFPRASEPVFPVLHWAPCPPGKSSSPCAWYLRCPTIWPLLTSDPHLLDPSVLHPTAPAQTPELLSGGNFILPALCLCFPSAWIPIPMTLSLKICSPLQHHLCEVSPGSFLSHCLCLELYVWSQTARFEPCLSLSSSVTLDMLPELPTESQVLQWE